MTGGLSYDLRRRKLDHLINSTTVAAGKAGFTIVSAATAVVEFVSVLGTLEPGGAWWSG